MREPFDIPKSIKDLNKGNIMANESSKPDNTARDMAVRTQALEMAIRSNCGMVYNNEGNTQYDAEEIVKAASKFEEFIKGNKKETW